MKHNEAVIHGSLSTWIEGRKIIRGLDEGYEYKLSSVREVQLPPPPTGLSPAIRVTFSRDVFEIWNESCQQR
jgi:hypothetical protein